MTRLAPTPPHLSQVLLKQTLGRLVGGDAGPQVAIITAFPTAALLVAALLHRAVRVRAPPPAVTVVARRSTGDDGGDGGAGPRAAASARRSTAAANKAWAHGTVEVTLSAPIDGDEAPPC